MNKKDLWSAYCDELADKLSNALGIDRDNMFDYKESALSMAEAGDVDAQLFFGFLSLFDPGRDVAKANHWLRAASDQNNIDAITTIGIMNYCGSSSPDSDAHVKAGVAFMKAASLGGELAEKMLMVIRSEMNTYRESNSENFISDEQLADLCRERTEEEVNEIRNRVGKV